VRRHRQSGRSINGIVLLDKPLGLTSNQSLQTAKRIFKARKAGHTGSLDKQASGLLPLCFGEATKFSGYLLNADKRYRARIRLGITTSTGDAEGEIIKMVAADNITDKRVVEVLESFVGRIEQVPPMHSAIKHNGQRLYKLAHQGMVVERNPRPVTIHSIAYLGRVESDIEIDISCSKGTYIRRLAEDVGNTLGCGGSVSALRRTGAGPYSAENMVDLDTLARLSERGELSSVLMPLESAVESLPAVRLSSDSAYYLTQGQAVMVPHAPTNGYVRIFLKGSSFIGIGVVLDDGRVAPKRLVRL